MIAVGLNDPRESELCDCGIVALEDAETGETVYVDSSDKASRKEYSRQNQDRMKKRERLFNSMGVDYVDVYTDTSYVDALVKFFLKRRKRAR